MRGPIIGSGLLAAITAGVLALSSAPAQGAGCSLDQLYYNHFVLSCDFGVASVHGRTSFPALPGVEGEDMSGANFACSPPGVAAVEFSCAAPDRARCSLCGQDRSVSLTFSRPVPVCSGSIELAAQGASPDLTATATLRFDDTFMAYGCPGGPRSCGHHVAVLGPVTCRVGRTVISRLASGLPLPGGWRCRQYDTHPRQRHSKAHTTIHFRHCTRGVGGARAEVGASQGGPSDDPLHVRDPLLR